MKSIDLIARARSQIGRGTIYALGKGGMRPDRDRCTDSQGKCDCTGFTAWCHGVSRKTNNPWYLSFNGGWMNTDAIVRDCGTTLGTFDQVTSNYKQGMLIVWPGNPAEKKIGHAGIISEVHQGNVIKVIHCSKGNYHDWHDAIRETGPELFLSHAAIVAACGFVEYA
jgi:hypothetical protein